MDMVHPGVVPMHKVKRLLLPSCSFGFLIDLFYGGLDDCDVYFGGFAGEF